MTALHIHAEGYPYLVLENTDGSTYSLSASGLTLTFSDGNLVASDGTTVSLSQLRKMYFSETSSINNLKHLSSDEVTVFTPSGVSMGHFPSISTAVSRLPKGLYIIQEQDGMNHKITVK